MDRMTSRLAGLVGRVGVPCKIKNLDESKERSFMALPSHTSRTIDTEGNAATGSSIIFSFMAHELQEFFGELPQQDWSVTIEKTGNTYTVDSTYPDKTLKFITLELVK